MRRFPDLFFILFFLAAACLFPLTAFAYEPAEDLTSLQWGMSAEYGVHVPYFNDPAGNMREEIIVAVIDGGIDYTHPDLADVIYEFSEEEQAALGCGRYGYDAVQGDGETPRADYHGTHVAGIIGASWDKEGISGICSNVKIISINCSVGDDTPLDYCMKAYEFVIRALDYGIPIRVINNSWGNVDSSLAMNELVEEAGRRGALSVFAAGNYANNLEDTVFVPSSFLSRSPYAVIVGSVSEGGSVSYFSSYGETVVDIFAPGDRILSTLPYENLPGDIYTETDGYAYMNGTSMATPAVTGAAAYLAGNHPEVTDAAGLKTLLLSCTTPTAGAETLYANGLLDLSVDLTYEYAPVITQMEGSEDGRITVTGVHFGEEEGYLEVLDASCAGAEAPCEITDVSWSDTSVSFSFRDTPPPVVKVYLEEAVRRKHDASVLYLYSSDAVMPLSLSVPDDRGARDLIDSIPDYQSAGFLGASGRDLYYLPFKFLVEDVIVGFEQLYRYRIDEDVWEELAPLPERVVATQAVFVENDLLVVGTDADRGKSLAYLYEIANDTWRALDASQIPLLSTVVNCDGKLLLIGGAENRNGLFRAMDSILLYDPLTGTCTPDGTLAQGVWGAQAVYGDGILYVYGSDQTGAQSYLQYFQVVTDDDARLLDAAQVFPRFRRGEGNRRPKFNVALHGALLYADHALYLTGPLSDDGQADTYVFDADNNRFTAAAFRLSDAQAIWPAACFANGSLYVMARSPLEPGFLFFRSMVINEEEAAAFAAEKDAAEAQAARYTADLLFAVIRLIFFLQASG